jgi:hypothetical protein
MSEKDPLDDLPWPKPAEPSAGISDSIRRECTHALDRKQCARAHRRAALSLLFPTVAIGIFTVLAILRGDPDETVRSALYGVAGWVMMLVVVLTVGLALPPGKRLSRTTRIAMALTIPAVFIVYITATASAHDSFATFSQGAPAHHALRCGLTCLMLGAIVSGGVLFLWRGTDPLTPTLSGALAGLTGGLGSALALGVACPSHEAWHVGVSHGLVVVAMVGFGALVGRRLLSP